MKSDLKRRGLLSALVGVAAGLSVGLAGLSLSASAEAATVCCFRYADAAAMIRNQVLFSPSPLQIDWSRAYFTGNAGGALTEDTRVSTPAGVWSVTSAGWTWITADPPGEPTGSRGRCHWTTPVPISGTVPGTCEVKYWN